MKEEILKLREEGKTYKQICDELGCSKGTVAYHCGVGQKEKTRTRTREQRKNICLLSKIDHFKHRKNKNSKVEVEAKCKRNKLNDKSRDFQRGSIRGKSESNFNYKDVIKKFGEIPTCYLTGRVIDLKMPRTYNFDHIVPSSKGGNNNLENLGITCRDVNVAKNDMSVDEFLQLCKEVLEYNGYIVTKQ